MAARTSNGTGGGNWSATASWSGGVVPGDGDTVTIQNGDTITWDAGAANPLIVGADTTTAAIAVASGGKFQILSSIAAGTYILRLKGDFSNSGTVELGTAANPLGKDRIVNIELNYSTTLTGATDICKYGWKNNAGSTFTAQGFNKTYSHSLLDADIAACLVWESARPKVTGDIVTPTQDYIDSYYGEPGHTWPVWYQAQDPGETSGEGEPNWSDEMDVDDTIVDNDITWKAISPQGLDFTIEDDTTGGWLDNDWIAIAPKNAWNEFALVQLDADAASVNLSSDNGYALSGGVMTAITNYITNHTKTGYRQSEILNLTRNIVFKPYDTNNVYCGYMVCETTSVNDLDWVEFKYMGKNATDKYGITVKTTTGSFNAQNCSVWKDDPNNANGLSAFEIRGTAANNITISNNVFFNIYGHCIGLINATSGNSITISGNWGILGAMYASGVYSFIYLNDYGVTCANNRVCAGYNGGMRLAAADNLGTGITAFRARLCGYGSGSPTVQLSEAITGGTLEDFILVHNLTEGILFGTKGSHDVLIKDGIIAGNGSGNIVLGNTSTSTGNNRLTFDGCTFGGFDADGTPFGETGISVIGTINDINFFNCTLGTASGEITENTSGDVIFNGAVGKLKFNNCKLSSTIPVDLSLASDGSEVTLARDNQTDGQHKRWTTRGTINSNGEEVRATPSSATLKLEIPVVAKKVVDGETITFSVDVTKSALYNGNQPRLIIKRDDAMGITADTVLDTMTAAVTVKETLTGTTTNVIDDGGITAYIDCDGTAGYLTIDDASAT